MLLNTLNVKFILYSFYYNITKDVNLYKQIKKHFKTIIL